MRYIKCETADKPKRCPESLLQHQAHYYRHGGGRERSARRYQNLTPEQKKARRVKLQEWRSRNPVRLTLLRLASNCRARIAKKTGKPLPFDPWDGIGCNVAELQAVIEAQFEPGMSWENRSEWEIDHIEPFVSFDLMDPLQAKRAMHYSNLQVLWKSPHIAKSRGEHMAYMEKLARDHWQKVRGTDWPGFKTAWALFTKRTVSRSAPLVRQG